MVAVIVEDEGDIDAAVTGGVSQFGEQRFNQHASRFFEAAVAGSDERQTNQGFHPSRT